MILIVGLGNPGKKYEKTRHNIGFRVVDELHSSSRFAIVRLIENFSGWKYEKKCQAEISQGKIDNQKMILAKPQVFMNNSGKSVKSLIDFYKITSPGLVVIHDDIDLPSGKIRISKGRGAAGHKGVESIIRAIDSKNFIRFRVGIQPETKKPKNTETFVLQKFTKEEEKIIKEVVKRTCQMIKFAIIEGAEKAMSKYNK